MKPGKAKFLYYVDQIESQLMDAAKDINPAWWMYTHNTRTPLFMLEGLAKAYAHIHNPKRFEKLKARVKLLEDGIGQIDYYDNVAKDLRKMNQIPESIIHYLEAQAREKIQHLNEVLKTDSWIGDDPKSMGKIRAKLEDADWEKEKRELAAIEDFYRSSIQEIKDFMPTAFTELESQVHSMRRKLRWLSIYPQAFQGSIQLHDNGTADPKTDKYLTEAIVKSPFNQLPAIGQHQYQLQLEKKYFLSLSWMIAELGRIKDEGLTILAVTEALQQAGIRDQNDARQHACAILGKPANQINQLLDLATVICKRFLDEGILDQLIVGIEPNMPEA